MPKLSEKLSKSMPFISQHVLLENPRAPYSELGRKIGCSRQTAKEHLNELYSLEILYPPQWRLLMNYRVCEYVYLLKVDEPESFVSLLREMKWIFHYSILAGPFNLILYSYLPLDFSYLDGYEQTTLSGIRSNYYVPLICQQSYETAFKHISQRCETKIEPSMFDMTLKEFSWTEELWNLYTDLKYNISMDFTSIVKKYGFKSTTFYERLKLILQCTQVIVPLYPLTEKGYLLFYFLFKTKYQKFIAESFGELPVFSLHYRIKDSLLSYIAVPHGMENEHFRNIIHLWKRKGIIDSYEYSIPWWSKTIQPGAPFPPPPPLPSPSMITIPVIGEGSAEKLYRFSI